jgi:hypothetical protein
VKTEAHNTVMVDGREQAGGVNVAGGRDNPDHRGTIADLVSTPWYAHLTGDASMAYEPDNLTSFVREVLYLRHVGATTPPDYFLLFDDLETPALSPIDWMLHTYGSCHPERSEGSAPGSGQAPGKALPPSLTITQSDAAVDVTLVSPERFTTETKDTVLKEINTPEPFPGAPTVKTIKIRPAEQTTRTHFLSVLAPREAAAAATLSVTPLRQPGLVGADIAAGAFRDRALFALETPAMTAAGVEVVGRTALVRTSGGRLLGAVLHNGQKLTADGTLLFETDSAGHAVLTFTDRGVEGTLNLYNPRWFSLHVARPPARVLVNGKEHAFTYDAGTQSVKIESTNPREVKLEY